MNFDLSWFTTIPGMFITGGVILLIIALISLIATGKKSKKEKKKMEEKEQMENQTPEVESVEATTSVPVENQPIAQPVVEPQVVNTNQPVEATPAPIENMQQPSVGATPLEAAYQQNPAPIINNIGMPSTQFENMQPPVVEPQANVQPVYEPPVVEPVPVTPVTDNISINPVPVEAEPVQTQPTPSIPTFTEPVIEPVKPIVDNINVNTTPTYTTPVYEQPAPSVPTFTEPVVEPVQTQPVNPQPEPVIYGGASPIVTDINLNQNTQHQIYGGADPLQNTQTIPTVTPVAPINIPMEQSEPVMVAPVEQLQPQQEVQPVGTIPVQPVMPTENVIPTIQQ